MAINFEQFNMDVQQWGNQAANAIQQKGSAMGITHSAGSPSPKSSLQAIIAKFKMDSGLVHIVSFKVPRSLIFVHKGAGKGMGGSKGSSWADKYGQQHKTNPNSMGKMGTGNRQPKPFYDAAMNAPDGIDALGDIVTQSLGDAFVNNLLIK